MDKPVLKKFTPIITLVALCWLIFVVNNLLWNGGLNQYGIIPRHIVALPGILWAPFLHTSVKHLTANSLPLLILGAIICARSRLEFVAVAAAGVLVGGGLTWLFARNASHVGASGLIFCLFGYLASLAYFRRTFGALIVAVVCLFAYGGMLKGILPTATAISWESHVAGLVSGIAIAWIGSKLNPPPKDLEIKPVGLGATLEK